MNEITAKQIRADADACLLMLTAFPVQYSDIVRAMTANLQRIKRLAEPDDEAIRSKR